MNIKITSLRLGFFSLILLAACNQLPQGVPREAATELQPASGHSYNYVLKWGTPGTANGQFYGPHGVAVDGSGNVYVTDQTNHNVQKFSSTGAFITKWGTPGEGNGQFNGPRGVAVDGSGNVYVTDLHNYRIQKFSSTGTFITKWGASGTADGQFDRPIGVAVDGSGNVYVADTYNHRIQKFSSTGTFITKWGASGTADGQFNNPGGVAVDGSGNVYVVEAYNHRIQKFSSTGTFITKWGASGTADGQFSYPNGLAVDGSGNVYVPDTYNHRIQKFSSTGIFITKWGAYGPADGQFSYPRSVAVDGSGNVYVADGTNSRIQKFAAGPVKASQTITFDTLANKTFSDAPFEVSATASSGLLVTLTSDTTGVCTVSGKTVTLVAAGTCTITASQDGDGDYAAATPVTQSFTVAKAAQVLTFAEGTPTTAERGTSATLEVTSTTTTPIVLTSTTTGVCTVSGVEVSFIATGTCTVTAAQAATANYNAGSASHEIAVVRTLTNTALSNVSGSGTYGGNATLTATLSKAGGDFLSGKTVAFTIAGTDAGNAVTNGSGVATLTDVSLTGKNAGDYEVTASFAGDDDAALAASDGTGTLTVARAAQTITFTSSAPTDPRTGTSYTVSATATSGLDVSFSASPASVCSISGNTVSFENPGSCTVAADQGGSTNYAAAAQQTQSITVVPADTTPPVIVPTVSGTLGSSEWYTSNVTVSWSVTDDESAVTNQTGCGSTTINADTAGTTLTCSATSAGGNSSESVTLKRDATPPTLAPTVSATQVLLNGSVTATPNASDSTSGIASQSCAEAATNTVGNKSVSCTASDNAGNSTSASVDYSVIYGFSGFSQPVNNDAPNKAKAGQAIPLKWRLTDAAGLPVTTLTGVNLTVASLSCSFDTVPGEVEEYAPGSSGLQNLGDGYYQFNWKTPTSYANSCKTLRLDMSEGIFRTAAFQFTK